MKRIGIAASKISKGNILLYNLYVLLIASLFSFFVFVLVGCSVLFALIIISYVGSEVMAFDTGNTWTAIITACMVILTVLTLIFNLVAILTNIKLPKHLKHGREHN